MTRFTLDRKVAADQASVFAYLTDPSRLRRWLPWTEEIENLGGPLDRPGSTFSQRGAKGMRRPGGVVAADPPRSWHLRIAGYGERVDLEFNLAPAAGGTHVSVAVAVRNGPGALGVVVDVFARRLDRRSWQRALDRLAADVDRQLVAVEVGDLVSVESGGIIRLAQVIGLEERYVHLRLFAGRQSARPGSVDVDSLGFGRPRDHHAVRPLMPTVRSAAFSPTRGAPGLLVDGGFGIAHLPLTRRAFDDAEPRGAGHARVPDDATATIAAWRTSGGTAIGEDREPQIGAFFSVPLQALGVDAIGFGVVKLLHQQFRGVHVRVYSNVFGERPARIDESGLESRPAVPLVLGSLPLTEPLAIGHMPLSHASFTAWQPEFIAIALVHPDELLGYEEWKLAKGGFF